jgi:4-hydroxybutyryl-CoA dehydratase/vinylacetyl-CoA-Delta-isomerase
MTLGRNAVGYLTESLHGAGSPQTQRIQISKDMQLNFKKNLAKELAGIKQEKREDFINDISDYFARVFKSLES